MAKRAKAISPEEKKPQAPLIKLFEAVNIQQETSSTAAPLVFRLDKKTGNKAFTSGLQMKTEIVVSMG